MMDRRRRSEIKHFCREFLSGDIKHLNRVIHGCDMLLSGMDLTALHLSSDNLDDSFRTICSEVFTSRPQTYGYIIAILAFTVEIDKFLHRTNALWYQTDMIELSLVSVLGEIKNFKPIQLYPRRCIIL